MLIDQLPPDSHAAILSHSPTFATAGSFGALVPTSTTRVTGLRVTTVLVALRLTTLPSWETTRYVVVLLPSRPAVLVWVLPRSSLDDFCSTGLVGDVAALGLRRDVDAGEA